MASNNTFTETEKMTITAQQIADARETAGKIIAAAREADDFEAHLDLCLDYCRNHYGEDAAERVMVAINRRLAMAAGII